MSRSATRPTCSASTGGKANPTAPPALATSAQQSTSACRTPGVTWLGPVSCVKPGKLDHVECTAAHDVLDRAALKRGAAPPGRRPVEGSHRGVHLAADQRGVL